MDTTRELLADTPPSDPTVDLADALGQVRSELADGSDDPSLTKLYRVAAAADIEDADDLVQQALLDVISGQAPTDPSNLVETFIPPAAEDATQSLNEDEVASVAYDPECETAHLFYPEFYEEGPDAGRFVDSPNDWGHVIRSSPEEEFATVELFGVTDSAIDDLPEPGMTLITLVDVEGASLEDAARTVHISQERAAQVLNRARIHVRGAIDNYLNTPEA